MRYRLHNYENDTTTVKETPLTLRQFLSINFGGWGFYKIIQETPKKYVILDKFNGNICYTIEKIK